MVVCEYFLIMGSFLFWHYQVLSKISPYVCEDMMVFFISRWQPSILFHFIGSSFLKYSFVQDDILRISVKLL